MMNGMMRVRMLIAMVLAALLLMGGVQAAPRSTVCAAFDLTGRALRNTIYGESEIRCVYKRAAPAEECPLNTAHGWTIVGVIDAEANRDKVTCVYQDLAPVADPPGDPR